MQRGLSAMAELLVLYVQVGSEMKFLNSYVALFPNFAERPASDYRATDPFILDPCDTRVSGLTANPSGRVMPDKYFLFVEVHLAGNDLYFQTDGRPSVGTVTSGTIGFR